MARATQNVHRRVRRVARAARGAVHARALCCALGTALFTLALTTRGGRPLLDLEAACLAAALGIVCGVAWVLSQPRSTHDVACALDEGFRAEGALLSAYENASRPERAMAELGAKAMDDPRKWVRAHAVAVPHYPGFIAVPLVALAILFQSVTTQHEQALGAGVELRQVRDLASGIQRALSDHAGALDEQQLAAMAGALHDARAAAEGEDDPGEMMDEVAAELDELAQTLPPGSEAAEALRDLALEAEVLRVGDEEALPEEAAEPDLAAADQGAAPGEAGAEQVSSQASSSAPEKDTPRPEEVAAGAADTGADTGADAGQAQGAQSEGDLAAAPGPGAARPEESPEASGGQAPPPAAAPRSAATARWWGDRDDGLVRRWLAREQDPKR